MRCAMLRLSVLAAGRALGEHGNRGASTGGSCRPSLDSAGRPASVEAACRASRGRTPRPRGGRRRSARRSRGGAGEEGRGRRARLSAGAARHATRRRTCARHIVDELEDVDDARVDPALERRVLVDPDPDLVLAVAGVAAGPARVAADAAARAPARRRAERGLCRRGRQARRRAGALDHAGARRPAADVLPDAAAALFAQAGGPAGAGAGVRRLRRRERRRRSAWPAPCSATTSSVRSTSRSRWATTSIRRAWTARPIRAGTRGGARSTIR